MSPEPNSPFGQLSPEAQKTLGQRTSFGGAPPNFSRSINAPGTSGQESALRTVERLIGDYEKVEMNVANVRGRSFREGLDIIKQRVQAGFLKRDITYLARKIDSGEDKVTKWESIRFNIPREIENAPEAYKAAFEERKKMFEENTGILGATSRTIERRTKETRETERTVGQQMWDMLKKREDFSVGQRMGRGLGMAGVAALSGTAAGVFGAVGGIAGGAVRATSTALAEATKAAARAAGEIVGVIGGGLIGGIIGFVTGGPAGVIKGIAQGASAGGEVLGEVGAGLGEIASSGIKAAGGALSEMMTAVSGMAGASIDAAVPIYYQYEKQHTRLSALMRGRMQRTVGQNLMFGYSRGQSMQIMEQYARVTGTTEGSQDAMRYSRMYGVDPEKAIEVATIARRAGVMQGYRGILQSIAGATHRAGMGTGRIGEQIASLNALSELSMRFKGELGPEGLHHLIGLQGFFAQQGEAYRGQYGVKYLGNLQGAMTQNQDPYARQLMWRSAGRGGGSLGERMKRYEAGVFEPGAIERLVEQVKDEYGGGDVAKVALHTAMPNIRMESISTLLETKDLGGEIDRIAKEEGERAMKIGAGSFLTQELEGINIDIGVSAHGMLEQIETTAILAMDALSLQLTGGTEAEVREAARRFGDSAVPLTEAVGELAGGLVSRLGLIKPSDLRSVMGEKLYKGAQEKGLLASGGWSQQIAAALAASGEMTEEDFTRFIKNMNAAFPELNLTDNNARAIKAGEYEIIMVPAEVSGSQHPE